jgi:putative glutamine amidotransferase
VDVRPERGECRDALDQRLPWLVCEAGGIPAPVPNGLHEAGLNRWLAVLRPGAVVLSGGNDLGDRADRDRTEEALLAYAHDNALPLLGICRGMQMLAAWAGTPLRAVGGHVAVRHRLLGADVAGPWPKEVNSFHAFALASCPRGFQVAAWSEDGAIEAIRHNELPWEGWMWHPEREPKIDLADSLRLRLLLSGSVRP